MYELEAFEKHIGKPVNEIFKGFEFYYSIAYYYVLDGSQAIYTDSGSDINELLNKKEARYLNLNRSHIYFCIVKDGKRINVSPVY